jgi:hypothetical protein
VTFSDQLLNRDALQGSTVFLDKVQHFPHGVIVAPIAVSGK